MSTAARYFVCGTAANRKGFEYATPKGGSLPGNPPSYLDIAPNQHGSESHMLSQVTVDGTRCVRYARYRSINPSDEGIDRGAYVAVGFLLCQKMSVHTVAQCVDQASRIFSDVVSRLGANNAFAPDFRLGKYNFPGMAAERPAQSELSSVLLTDFLMQAMHGNGKFKNKRDKIAVTEQDYADAGSADSDIVYLSPTSKKPTANLDQDRENLRRLAEQILIASSHLNELHTKWTQHAQTTAQGASALLKSSGGLSRLLADLDARSASVHALATPNPEPKVVQSAQKARPTPARQSATLQTNRRGPPDQIARETPLSLESDDAYFSHSAPRQQHQHSHHRQDHFWTRGKVARFAIAGAAVAVLIAVFGLIATQGTRSPEYPRATRDDSPSDLRPLPSEDRTTTEHSSIAEQRAALDAQERDAPESIDPPE
ncbi:MAG: hypothetical protein AB8G17_14585 [Gammaproteobacteria bacterium]